jgi:hypothetical protein
VRLVAASTLAKCSVGPAGEQVELSASPRRPAASPTRLSALADGALRSRHETSGAPALLSAAASTTLEARAERLALGQAARSRQRRRRCATSSRCLRACRARRSSAAWRRAQLRCAHLNGEHLFVWVGGGVGDSSKKNRRQASQPESGEVFFETVELDVLVLDALASYKYLCIYLLYLVLTTSQGDTSLEIFARHIRASQHFPGSPQPLAAHKIVGPGPRRQKGNEHIRVLKTGCWRPAGVGLGCSPLSVAWPPCSTPGRPERLTADTPRARAAALSTGTARARTPRGARPAATFFANAVSLENQRRLSGSGTHH